MGIDFDAARPEATPRKAQGNTADIARNERREKFEYGMAESYAQRCVNSTKLSATKGEPQIL